MCEALVIGAVLVPVILFLFLLNFRTTFIALTANPLSLVITTLVFRLLSHLTGTQLSINVMTLGGIAVAMGELVGPDQVALGNQVRGDILASLQLSRTGKRGPCLAVIAIALKN